LARDAAIPFLHNTIKAIGFNNMARLPNGWRTWGLRVNNEEKVVETPLEQKDNTNKRGGIESYKKKSSKIAMRNK